MRESFHVKIKHPLEATKDIIFLYISKDSCCLFNVLLCMQKYSGYFFLKMAKRKINKTTQMRLFLAVIAS